MIPKTMSAVRLHGKGYEHLRVEEIPVPVPNPRQLLARVEAAGVCTSILKLLDQGSEHSLVNGWDLAAAPLILGDEGCITIVKAGGEVAARYPEGGRYAIQPAVDVAPINHRERYRNRGAGMLKVAVGYTLPGHLAEYMLIPEEVLAGDCLVPMPSEDIPAFAGALCEPLSCVLSAHQRHVHIHQASPRAPRRAELGLLPGGVVVVVGAGAMGRLHAEVALAAKPRHLLVVDIDDQRLQWVREVLLPRAIPGVMDIHAVAGDGYPVLRELTDGRGADDILVAVGARQVQIEAQQWLAKGGVLNLFGGLKRGEHVIDLDSLRVHYDEIKVVGSSGGSPADVAQALEMTARGDLDVGMHLDLVGSLDQCPEALRRIRDHEVDGKIVLYPGIKSTPLQAAKRWGRREEEAFLRAHG